MGKKNKGNNNLLPLLAVGGALLLLGGKKSSNKYTGVQQPGQNNTGDLVDDLQGYEFDTNNGITSPVGTDIIPFIVPSSFVVKKVTDKVYYDKLIQEANGKQHFEKIYVPVAKISFLMCIYCPTTSLGGLTIEECFFNDIQIVQYINDQQQRWWNLADEKNKKQLFELGVLMIGKSVQTGYNLFDISFYWLPDLSDPDSMNMYDYTFEAVSLSMSIKYEETRLCSWRCLSAWDIKEDTLKNDGAILETDTRFGVVRNAESKPRDQRGLFSEWWAEYLQNGYNTNIYPIESYSVFPNGQYKI